MSKKRHRRVAICQIYRLVIQLVKLQQICQFHPVATNQVCRNLSFGNLLQLVETTRSKPADDTFSQSTCNRLVVNKLSEAIRTHPNIGLVTSLLQDVNNLLQTCAFLAVKPYAYIYK